MRKGVISVEYEKRFVDRIANVMHDMKLYKTDGYYPIMEESTGKEVAAFVCIYGNGLIVRFLEAITQFRGKNLKKVSIDY